MSGAFHYSNPPTIIWGPRSIEDLAKELDKLQVQRPYLISTRSISGNQALMGKLRHAASRELAGVSGCIGQHAPQANVQEAIAAAKAATPDGIISVGGGSPIDAAKMVALELGALPHVAIPTTLSVAELAPSAGMTDEHGQKGGKLDPRMIARTVIYDAELALHTPLELWLSTGIRALDHAVETVLEPGEHPLSVTLAIDAVRRLFASLPQAKARPGALDVRTENQIGAWLSYTLPRVAGGLGHMLAKQIGSPFGIPHGVTSCLLLPHVMRYRARTQADRLALLVAAVGLESHRASNAELASAVAGAVYRLIGRLGLPQHLSAYHLTEQQLRSAAEPLVNDRYPLADLLSIYQAAA
ncbi:MAG TPA: iron-containing alcohol dehydrogenase [Chloroflexota bacterium]|nr:iron-containing alcohol dehydrogenase [Chloroflexota bacterium]